MDQDPFQEQVYRLMIELNRHDSFSDFAALLRHKYQGIDISLNYVYQFACAIGRLPNVNEAKLISECSDEDAATSLINFITNNKNLFN